MWPTQSKSHQTARSADGGAGGCSLTNRKTVVMHYEPLDYLPLWALFPLTVALIYGAIEAGYALGKYRRHATEFEKEGTVGPSIGSAPSRSVARSPSRLNISGRATSVAP